MATSRQTTFGKVSVNSYTGDRECDACTGYDGNGEPKKCTNTASYTILRHLTGVAEFYCEIHAKDTWKDMCNNE